MRIIDRELRCIDYRLNILGIRVWEDSCQLISKTGESSWTALGPRWDLPVRVPRNAEELHTAAADPLTLTAYQYHMAEAHADLVVVLEQTITFTAALGEVTLREAAPIPETGYLPSLLTTPRVARAPARISHRNYLTKS
ncbi:MAG: hypothetical protein PSY14_06385 [bacterium]|nr:hypothetical protein [bacterium]